MLISNFFHRKTKSGAAAKVSVPERKGKIIRADECSGELMYLLKWEGIDMPQIIAAEEARYKYPQIVIKFLEKEFERTVLISGYFSGDY